MELHPFGSRRWPVEGHDPIRRGGRGVVSLLAGTFALGALVVAPRPASAQDAGGEAVDAPACQFRVSGDRLRQRLSPPDSSAVRLGEGVAKICYGSPRARDREIMGGLVPFGEPWRLGANEPTTLHVTVPARVGDVGVEPGAYSLYAVPGPEGWQIVVNAATDRWGVPIDASVREHDVGSVTVPAESTGEYVEALSVELRPDDGTARLVVSWERTRVTVPLSPQGS